MSFLESLADLANTVAVEANKHAIVAARVIAAEAPKHIQAAQNFASEASKLIAAEAPRHFEAAQNFAAEAVKMVAAEAPKHFEAARNLASEAVDVVAERGAYNALKCAATEAANLKTLHAEQCRKILAENMSTITEKVLDMTAESPAAVATLVFGLLTVAEPAVLSAPFVVVLRAFGFRRNGVAANSIAARRQSNYPHVPAGSSFSTLQSAAAGGIGIMVINSLSRVVGGTMAAAAAARLTGSEFGNSTVVAY